MPYKKLAALAVAGALLLSLTACHVDSRAAEAPPQAESVFASFAGSAHVPSFQAVVSQSRMVEAVPSVPIPRVGVARRLPVLTQEDVDQALASVMERYSAAAVSVAAIEGGKISQSGAWGWAVKNQREMTTDTKVRVASLTKVAVGLCAMAMAEDGILDLDAPLREYWGSGVGNPYSKGAPTARTLMTHTSSLRDLDTTVGLSRLRGLLQSKSSWRRMEPGDGGYWHYSNFGFCVLGTTLELASDQLLDNYFQARYLQPMDIRASFYSGNLEENEVATLYSTGGVVRSAASHTGQSVPTAIGAGAGYYPGGLTISAVDLAKLVGILAGDGSYEGVEYLSPEAVAEMETPQFKVTPSGAAPFQQCLVLRRQENIYGQEALYYHTGSAYGVFSLLSYNPDTGNGVVVITTGAPRKTDEYGLYALCAQLSADLYARMEK